MCRERDASSRSTCRANRLSGRARAGCNHLHERKESNGCAMQCLRARALEDRRARRPPRATARADEHRVPVPQLRPAVVPVVFGTQRLRVGTARSGRAIRGRRRGRSDRRFVLESPGACHVSGLPARRFRGRRPCRPPGAHARLRALVLPVPKMPVLVGSHLECGRDVFLDGHRQPDGEEPRDGNRGSAPLQLVPSLSGDAVMPAPAFNEAAPAAAVVRFPCAPPRSIRTPSPRAWAGRAP